MENDENKDKKEEYKDLINIPEPKRKWSNYYLFPIFIGLLAIGILVAIIVGSALA